MAVEVRIFPVMILSVYIIVFPMLNKLLLYWSEKKEMECVYIVVKISVLVVYVFLGVKVQQSCGYSIFDVVSLACNFT